jgi:hypothetical protein
MAEALMDHIKQPQFVLLLQQFLYNEINLDLETPSADILLDECPRFVGTISVYYSPSDLCSAGGMYRECIHSNPDWHGGYAELDGMLGMAIGCTLLFFSFKFRAHKYSCALIHWLTLLDQPDEDTGMWVVQPEFEGNGCRTLSIIHLDCVVRKCTFSPFMVLLFYQKISTLRITLIHSMHTLLTPILTTIATSFYNNKQILSYLII